jgi:hypothetical protein
MRASLREFHENEEGHGEDEEGEGEEGIREGLYNLLRLFFIMRRDWGLLLVKVFLIHHLFGEEFLVIDEIQDHVTLHTMC